MYLQLAASQNQGLVEALVKGESEYVKHFEKIKLMTDLRQAGKFQEALNNYYALPVSVQKDKTVLLVRFAVSVQADEQEYVRAMEDLKTALPDDPCLDLILVDAHFLKREYHKAIKCLDRFEKVVGEDAYIKFLRGNVQYASGDRPNAQKSLRKAIAQEPTLVPPYWTLVTISLEDKAFADTAKLLTTLEKTLLVPIAADLSQVPAYAEFVKSKEYEQWMNSRQQP